MHGKGFLGVVLVALVTPAFGGGVSADATPAAVGPTAKTTTVDLPADATLVPAGIDDTDSVADGGTHGRATAAVLAQPAPPPGGDGAVVRSVTYETSTEMVVVPMVFFFIDGTLVDVQSHTMRHRLETIPR